MENWACEGYKFVTRLTLQARCRRRSRATLVLYAVVVTAPGSPGGVGIKVFGVAGIWVRKSDQ